MQAALRPALAALLLLTAAALAGLLYLGTLVERQARAAEVAATASELRSISRSLQRDVLLMALEDEAAHAKTVARFDRRNAEMAAMGERLDALLSAEGAPEAGRMAALHRDLGQAMAGMRDLALSQGRDAAWAYQQAEVLPREISAARTNDPIIERFRTEAAARAASLRDRLTWIAAGLAVLGLLGVAWVLRAGRR
ncbi:MAG TPA: hypothetical protein VED40_22490 [Azospirillaceae bacterium]|nr:hypothetical protein [Azospirillaceae bacterium]